MTDKLGLIAGNGNLPVLFAQGAKQAGIDLTVISVTLGAKTEQLKSLNSDVHQISVGQLERIINTLKEAEVSKVVMLGKVTKELLFQDIELDHKFQSLLASLPEKNDDAIMLAIVNQLAKEGIEVSDQTQFMKQFFPQAGILTAVEPDEEIIVDMEYGFKMAKEIGRLDIGQTVVVKDQAVIAVEAIEGTDQAILRGGQLAQGEIVAAKVSKPEQDLRFDIPTVGLKTIENLIEVDAKGLVIEAGKTFIINQSEVIKKANQAGIAIKALIVDS